MNRREFLSGVSAVAVATVAPIPKPDRWINIGGGPGTTLTINVPWTRERAKSVLYAANYGREDAMDILDMVIPLIEDEYIYHEDYYQKFADAANEAGVSYTNFG